MKQKKERKGQIERQPKSMENSQLTQQDLHQLFTVAQELKRKWEAKVERELTNKVRAE